MVAAITCAMTLAACTSSTRMAESTGQYIDSTAITSKVKTALLAYSGLKSGVKLSGVVSSDQAKAPAVEVAQGHFRCPIRPERHCRELIALDLKSGYYPQNQYATP